MTQPREDYITSFGHEIRRSVKREPQKSWGEGEVSSLGREIRRSAAQKRKHPLNSGYFLFKQAEKRNPLDSGWSATRGPRRGGASPSLNFA